MRERKCLPYDIEWPDGTWWWPLAGAGAAGRARREDGELSAFSITQKWASCVCGA